MSDTRHEAREWRCYVGDMIEFCEKVLSYTHDMDQDAFVADGLTYDATLRNLELIGEAATHIPDKVREEYPDIPWYAIVGTRNRLAHGYLGLNDHIIWTIIQDAIPQLLPALQNLLNTTSEGAA